MRSPGDPAPTGPDSPPRPRPAHAGPPADEFAALQAGRPPAAGAGPVRPLRVRLRPRTVRARVVALLMVPVVSLMALWGFATVTSAQDVAALIRLRQVNALLLTPVDGVVTATQAERTAAAVAAAAPRADRTAALRDRGRATDAALATLDHDVAVGAAEISGLGSTLPGRLAALRTAAAGLPALRARTAAGTAGWPEVMAGYGGVVSAAFGVDGALGGVRDSSVGSDPRVLLELARARDLLGREDAAVQSALAAGRMTAGQDQEFTGAAYGRQVLTAAAVPDLRPADRDGYLAVGRSSAATTLLALERAVRRSGPGQELGRTVPAGLWADTAASLEHRYAAVESAAGAGAAAGADPYRLAVFTRNGAAVLLGLLAVLLSLLISVRIGRRLVVELAELRNSALDLADRRLPESIRRLRAGEDVDIDAEAPDRDPGVDELGQVGAALHTVQRAALQAAVERAEVLSGISGVFVNLARRSQVLVHRQLALLDTMERRTEDPAELEDLFRLDHLTTRMRRHAEGLIILSGAAPGRAWRRSVPLLDVVRSAVAEVEEFSRVEVRPLPRVSVVGTAVADLVHLVAELVENATSFSPPHTKVLVSGERVGVGYALDIEDRGLGMSSGAVAEANRRIAEGQQADLFDSNQLGLFVVSRLARRHGVRVSLRTSPYGGTTAVLLLPMSVLTVEEPDRTAPAAAPWSAPRSVPRQAAPRSVPDAGRRDVPKLERAAEHEPERAAEPQPAPRPAARPEPDPRPQPEPQPHPAAVRTADADELPRRIRQASLAAPLREAPAPEPRPGGRGRDRVRSPESARATMSAMADGWSRGRTDDLE
ncbi:nitrate- and nitrite sensing domain-containing protein [Streptacidiphilus sp. N1-12]|uniref:Nitrate- and nitrite sensing domain-containing protein n=2 Tax=Streptacidiphilus alkalitolerans TaxID=3342712 RepID=A0ABV6W762_9ACTN